MILLKVAANSNPEKVAGALAGELRQHGKATLRGIGAGAVNQAVKAIIIASGWFAPKLVELRTVPGFADLTIDGEERTAIQFVVTARSLGEGKGAV